MKSSSDRAAVGAAAVRWRRSLPVAAAAVAVLALPAVVHAARQFLTEGEVLVLGVSLRVDPPAQIVPPGVPTLVHTSLVAAGQPDVPVPLGDLPPGMRVEATLTGPGLTPLPVECAPGSSLPVPALTTAGVYRLENIRLTNGGALLMTAEPAAAEVRVQDILISRVESRPLTAAEIEDLGIVVDSSNFQVLNYTIAMTLASGTVAIDIPMVSFNDGTFAVPFNQPAAIDVGPIAETPPPPRPEPQALEIVGFVPTPVEADAPLPEMRLGGALVFPQAIGYLNQFHSVLLLVTNGAPASSPLAIRDLTATFSLPAGTPERLRRVRTVPLTAGTAPVPVRDPGPDGHLGTSDDLALLAAQVTGSSELVTEGLVEGLHSVGVTMAGTVTGLPGGDAAIRGQAAGVVLVRNPSFALTFILPSVVEEGREFHYDVAVTNTSAVPANLVSLRLPRGSVTGAQLLGDELQVIPTIPAGESATARFRLRALRTGRIAASRFYHQGNNLAGRFDLQLAIGDDGIPISPEVLSLPDVAHRLQPGALVAALLSFAGTAWANATAPPGSLPPGMPQVDGRAVKRFAAQIADAGQRLSLGESNLAVLGHLLLRVAGGEQGDPSLDTLRRASSRWPEAAAELALALAAEIAAPGNGLDAGGAARAIAAEHFYLSPFLIAGLDVTAGGADAVHLRIEDAFHRRIGGAEGARDLPFGEMLRLGDLRQLGVVGQAPGSYSAVLEAAREATARLTLVVPHETGSGTFAPRQVVFDGVALAAGDAARVTFDPASSTYCLAVGTAAPICPPPEDLAAPPLELVAASVATAIDPSHHVVALHFNRPVDPASATQPSAYGFEGLPMAGQQVTASPVVQIAGRFVFLRLLDPVPPQPLSRVRVSGIRDRDGSPMAGSSVRDIAVPAAADWGTVGGVVVDGRGRPVGGARVELWETLPATFGGTYVPKQTAVALTDGSGAYRFWFGRLTGRVLEARVRDPRNGETASGYGRIQFDGEELRLNLRFLGRGDVTGRVVDGAGQPVDHALVTGRGTTQTAFRQVFTGGDGRFRLEDLAVGAVNLWVRTASGQVAARTVAIPDGGATVEAGDLVVDLVELATVHGRVASNGLPARALPVVLTSSRTTPPWGTWMRTDADGNFRFTGVPAASGAGSPVDVWVLDPLTGAELARTAGTLHAGTDLAIDLFYASGKGRVTGLVLDEWSHPVGAGRAVWIRPDQAVVTGADGRFALAGVPLGPGTVHTGPAIGLADASAGFSLHFDGQEAAAVLRLPARGQVRATVTRNGGLVDRASVALRATGLSCAITAGSAGSCTIGLVPTGRYTVDVLRTSGSGTSQVKEAGIGQVVVRHAGDNPAVTIDLPQPTTLEGTTYEGGTSDVLGGSRVELHALGLDSADHLDWIEYLPVTSDVETGRFAFPAVLAGSYSLRATNPTVVTMAGASGTLAGPADVDLVFPTSPVISVKVRVEMPDGSAIPAEHHELVEVVLTEILPTGRGPEHEQHGIEPTFALNRMTYLVEATYTPPGGLTYRTVTSASLQCDQVDPPFVVRLDGFGQVSGRVRHADGSPVTATDLTVTLRSAALPHEPAERSWTNDLGTGAFRFEDVREGFVSIQAEVAALGLRGSAWGQLADAGTLDRDVFFAPSAAVTGTVLGPSGGGAPDVAVFLKKEDHGSWIVVDAAATDPQGGFSLGPVEYDTTHGTAYRLFALDLFSGRFASDSLVLSGAAERTLRLGGRGTSEGFVFESNRAAPMSGALVDLQAGSAPELPGLALRTGADAAGFYQFLGVPEGRFDAWSRKSGTDLFARGNGEIHGEGDVERLDLVLEPHGVVAGQVTRDGAPVASAEVKLLTAAHPGAGAAATRMSAADGSFSFDHVPLGRFWLDARAGVLDAAPRFAGALQQDGEVASCELALNGFATVTATVIGQPPGIEYQYHLVDGGGHTQSAAATSPDVASFASVERGLLAVTAVQTTNPGNRGVTTVVLPAGATGLPVQIELGPVARVSGTLRDSDGETPVANVVLALTSGGESYLARTPADGTFDFGWVKAAGDLVLDARPDGGGAARARHTWGAAVDQSFDLVLDRTTARLFASAPADGATGVASLATVVLTFTERLDGEALDGKAVLVLDGSAVPGVTVSAAADATLRFAIPANTLQSARTYTAIVRATAEDLSGLPIGQDVAVRFTTQDATAPIATLDSPVLPSDTVPLTTPVRVRFSEPMDPATIAAGVVLSCAGADQGDPALDASRLVAAFPGPLPANATCSVSVNPAARDVAGNGADMTAPHAWSFASEDTLAPVLDALEVTPDTGPYPEGSTIAVTAVTASSDVRRVDFLVAGVLRASDDDGAPWTATIEVPAMPDAGGATFALSARAMDAAANASAALTLTLAIAADQPPLVAIERPEHPRYDLDAEIPVRVVASDDSGIAEVTWRVDGLTDAAGSASYPGSHTQETLEATFHAPADYQPGDIWVQATATDRGGNTVSATPVRVALWETSIRGLVRLPSLAPAPGIQVTLTGAAGTFTGTTSADPAEIGQYQIGARPGTYEVVFHEVDTGRRARLPGVVVEAGPPEDLGETTLGGAGVVRGVVRLAGQPFAGAPVRVVHAYGEETAISGASGGYEVGRVPAQAGLVAIGRSLATGYDSPGAGFDQSGDGFLRENVDLALREPVIASRTPESGPVNATSHTITIHGTHFAAGVEVRSDGNPDPVPVDRPDDTWIIATLPQRSAGVVPVEVRNPDGGVATTTFRYSAEDLGQCFAGDVWDLRLRGDTLYAATYAAGEPTFKIRLFHRQGATWSEVSSLSSPSGNAYYRLAATGDWLFAARASVPPTIDVIDVSNPLTPSILQSLPVRAATTDLLAYSPTEAWVAGGNTIERLQVVGGGVIKLPPMHLGTGIGRARLVGHRLYVAAVETAGSGDWTGGIRVFDVADPERPALLGERTGRFSALAVAGTRVVTMKYADWRGPAALELLEARDPRDIQVVSTRPWPAAGGLLDVTLSGERAYLAAGDGTVRVVSMTGGHFLDDETIDIVTGATQRVLIDGTSLYAAALAGGGIHAFQVLDQPRGPRPVAVTRWASPPTGGVEFAVAGYDFEPGATVEVGGEEAVVQFTGEDWLRLTAPPHGEAAGVTIAVRNTPAGAPGILAGQFDYTTLPRLFGIAPSHDTYLGGGTLRVDGINLAPGTTLNIGAATCPIVDGKVTAPPGAAGELSDVTLGPDVLHHAFLSATYRFDLERTGPIGHAVLKLAAAARDGGATNLVTYSANTYFTGLEFFRLDADGRVSGHGTYHGGWWSGGFADVEWVDDLLYISMEDGSGFKGVRVVDPFAPGGPVVVADITDSAFTGSPGAIVVRGDRLFSGAHGCVLDITDPSAPLRLGCLGTPLDDFRVEGRYVYNLEREAAEDRTYLRVYDYANPARPVARGSVWISGYAGLAVNGGRAFLHARTGVYSVDLGDPAAPALSTLFAYPAGQHAALNGAAPAPPVVIGDRVYAPVDASSPGGGGFQVFDAASFPALALGPRAAQRGAPDGQQPYDCLGLGSRILTAWNNLKVWLVETEARDHDPVLASRSPATGPTAGGAVVELRGHHFHPRARVWFGGQEALAVVADNSGHLHATAPAGGGDVAIRVENPDGRDSGPIDFHYQDGPPTITGIVPTTGPVAGGSPVQVEGWGFTGLERVVFHQAGAPPVEVPAADVTVGAGGTRLTFDLPAAPSQGHGPADVEVVTVLGQDTMADCFDY